MHIMKLIQAHTSTHLHAQIAQYAHEHVHKYILLPALMFCYSSSSQSDLDSHVHSLTASCFICSKTRMCQRLYEDLIHKSCLKGPRLTPPCWLSVLTDPSAGTRPLPSAHVIELERFMKSKLLISAPSNLYHCVHRYERWGQRRWGKCEGQAAAKHNGGSIVDKHRPSRYLSADPWQCGDLERSEAETNIGTVTHRGTVLYASKEELQPKMWNWERKKTADRGMDRYSVSCEGT